MTVTEYHLPPNTALRGPHGEIGEYLGSEAPGTSYYDRGLVEVRVRRMAGVDYMPASRIGTEWMPIPGRVVVVERATGRWVSPVERWLDVEPV